MALQERQIKTGAVSFDTVVGKGLQWWTQGWSEFVIIHSVLNSDVSKVVQEALPVTRGFRVREDLSDCVEVHPNSSDVFDSESTQHVAAAALRGAGYNVIELEDPIEITDLDPGDQAPILQEAAHKQIARVSE